MLLNMTGDAAGPRIYRKGGGGGSSSTSTSGLDPTFKPFVQRGLESAERSWQASQDPRSAANVRMRQQEALGERAASEGLQAQLGVGEYDRRAAIERDLSNVAGQQLAGASAGGNLTNARSMRAREGALADRSLQHQMAREEQIGRGLQAQQLGLQQASDAPHAETQRYFGYLAGAPGLTTSQSTSGSKQGK